MKYLTYLYLILFFFTINVETAKAVMPPDFIMNIGAQLFQIFSIVFIMITVLSGFVAQFLKTKLAFLRKKWVIVVMVVVVVLVSAGISYLYLGNVEEQQYQSWLEESQEYERQFAAQIKAEEAAVEEKTETSVSLPVQVAKQPVVDSDADGLSDEDEKEVYKTDPYSRDTDGDGYDDNVEIDNGYNPLVDQSAQVPGEEDRNHEFIKSYYMSIASGDMERAYTMSKKSVDFETFSSWYTETTDIRMDKMIRIDEERSSLELTLFEGDTYTRYGVLMGLGIEDGEPVHVKSSKVRIISVGEVEKASEVVEESPKVTDFPVKNPFFDEYSTAPLAIGNEDFKKMIDRDDYIVLDAREDLEFRNGHFPDSLHIRFADLKAGRWIELPKDKFIYVFCWSGLRGREVAEFLRTKKLVAGYLEGGAQGWYAAGGKWEGGIKFTEKYSEDRYRLVFPTDEVKEMAGEGVILVDCREPEKFAKLAIPGSASIPIMHTPSIDLEKAFAQVPPKSKVITICDGYVNCFDAKVTGVELESRGHEFLGRYNRPWEYK